MVRNVRRLARQCMVSLAFILCTAFAQIAIAQNTIHVPADQATIQAAITAAQPGDTVLVAPGTYIENLDFNGKAITITSSDGPSVTTVDGGAAGPVVTFKSNEDANSVINGFTLQNGVPSQTFPGTGTSGAGVWIYYSSPTITNNFIVSNHAICGIGIEIQGGSAMVRGNTISDNTQAGGTGGCGGGGIEITGDSSHPVATPQIIGNTIMKNSLAGGGFGGGIAVEYFASPLIQNNYIVGNTAYNSGGGIFLQSQGTPVVVQNIILDNSSLAGGSGGGIGASSQALLVNNTIVGNTAFDGSSGIFADRFGPITVSNNIVVAASGQTGIVCSDLSTSFPVFSHNDVTSPGGGQTYSSNCAAAAQGNGNISLDPLFVNATTGDYHLQSGSPAVDAGDNTAPSIPQQDYDNNPRVVDGNGDCTDGIDMGVYELQSTVQAAFSPASLTFGNQALNTTSSNQAVTLSSNGTGCLKITSLAVTGDFALSTTCGASLAAGQSCVVNVNFTPTQAGTRTGAVTLSGNLSGSTPSVALSGTGFIPAVISVAPSAINFGTLAVGTESTAQTVTVTNTGGSTLHINSQLVSGDSDFFLSTSNCINGTGVAPGASCSIQLMFFPHSAGAGSATLTIGSDAANNPVSVALSGTGGTPNPVFSAAAIGFGNVRVGATATQSVTLTNTGNADFSNNGLTLSGNAGFTQTNNCPATLAAGQSCTVNVSFLPTARGPLAGTLNVSPTQPMSTPTVSLSGTGVAPVAVLTQSLSFAAQSVGSSSSQTATLSNAGDAALDITSIVITGDFTQANACGAVLAPGAACNITVSFVPTASGTRSGTLAVTDDSLGAPQQNTALSGTGIDYAVSAPSSVSVRTGSKVQITVSVSAIGGTFSNPVALSCSGLPVGASCAFSPTSVVPGSTSASSKVTINTASSGGTKTPSGTYSISVIGSSGSAVRSAPITLTVTK